MAEAPYRGMNQALHVGQCDGKYKQIIKDRGGMVEQLNVDRMHSLPEQYEIREAPIKMTPSGRCIDMNGNIISVPAPATVGPGLDG